MMINATILVNAAWQMKAEISWWWLTVAHLFFTLLLGRFLLLGTSAFDLPLKIFTGIQAITNGLLMIVFAFALRKIQQEFNTTVRQIKEEHEDR